MSHGPTVCSRSTFFMVLTRAPLAPKTEESAAKAVRNAILHHKVAKYNQKGSTWLVRNVSFPHAKLMISCFHKKLTKKVLIGSL